MSFRSGIELPDDVRLEEEKAALLRSEKQQPRGGGVLYGSSWNGFAAPPSSPQQQDRRGKGDLKEGHHAVSFNFPSTRSAGSDPNHNNNDNDTTYASSYNSAGNEDDVLLFNGRLRLPSLRRLALFFSLNVNIAITIVKLVAYVQSWSLSVLAALLDSVLDILSQLVLNYTERHSSLQRSSAFYPAGASRLEPIGVLTCAALMGMASFEVLKESATSLVYQLNPLSSDLTLTSFWNMLAIIAIKLALLWLCRRGANRRVVMRRHGGNGAGLKDDDDDEEDDGGKGADDGTGGTEDDTAGNHNEDEPSAVRAAAIRGAMEDASDVEALSKSKTTTGAGGVYHNAHSRAVVQLADPTMEALAQDHFNDVLSNAVAAVALLVALKKPQLWFLDPVGAILISLYIIYSWYQTGREQIEHLTGKSAPNDLIDELQELAQNFDERMEVDVVRAYHFGPKFLVEIEVVMPKTTLLFESHDVGMELQYEIESREEVERCFVHIDYQQRPYDEHVVSKVPELREKYRPKRTRSARSL